MTGQVQAMISPCPNDTFVFHGLVSGLVAAPAPAPGRFQYRDIHECNAAAMAGTPDLVKVSVAALPWLLPTYQLLPCGGAVGRGCGPLVLTRPGGATDREGLTGARIAIPGEQTTAYLLLRLWAGEIGDIVAMPFDRIMPAVRDGVVDAGLVIHESRFTYPSYGLREVVDLGQWWEEDSGLPIPLGAIVLRAGLDSRAWSAAIRSSVDLARRSPELSATFVREHAQETAPDVVRAHIDLYVNDLTYDVGEEGAAAIRVLLRRAADAGLVPATEVTFG